ncbi:MAG: hypothetical protein LBJ65_14225 [Burkholderia sp.]|jgi:putative intracellular protease/amidase|nr:hypothetical protein [Burkholderia sp.]
MGTAIRLPGGTSTTSARGRSRGNRITGYSWLEEILAGVAKKGPYNVEQQMQQRGARYEKALLPFTSNVVVDGRLVTGQNPQSAKTTAALVVALLSREAPVVA